MSAADTFDLWLKGRLRHDLLPLTAVQPPAPRYKAAQPGVWSLKLTLATAGALAALLLSGIGAFAATVTGSVDPRVWGDQLKDCSQLLGESGTVRECFSDLIRKHEKGGGGPLPAAPRPAERDIDRPVVASRPASQPAPNPPAAEPAAGAPPANPPPPPAEDAPEREAEDARRGTDTSDEREKADKAKGEKDKGGDKGKSGGKD